MHRHRLPRRFAWSSRNESREQSDRDLCVDLRLDRRPEACVVVVEGRVARLRRSGGGTELEGQRTVTGDPRHEGPQHVIQLKAEVGTDLRAFSRSSGLILKRTSSVSIDLALGRRAAALGTIVPAIGNHSGCAALKAPARPQSRAKRVTVHHSITQYFHVVQGVASSNPATPTKEDKG